MMTLRPAVAGDMADVHRWRNAPEVARNMYSADEIPLEDHEPWFARAIADEDRRFWVVEQNGEGIGLAYIQEWNREHGWAWWGLYIADEAARRAGLGSLAEFLLIERAFEELKLHKLCCEVLAFNAPVMAMHKRFGFHVDGILREHVQRDGKRQDVHSFSLLRDEWEAKRTELLPVMKKMQTR